MKSRIAAIFLCALLALTGCGGGAPEAGASAVVPHTAASVEGTVFTYDGTDYEITERYPSVNALEIYGTVGTDYLIVYGHIGPNNGYYGVFNTETKTFEKDLIGAGLTFYGDDVNTIVYTFWNEIYDYDGARIAVCALEEREFLSDLSYSEDGTALDVTVRRDETERTERIALPTE